MRKPRRFSCTSPVNSLQDRADVRFAPANWVSWPSDPNRYRHTGAYVSQVGMIQKQCRARAWDRGKLRCVLTCQYLSSALFCFSMTG